MERIHMTISLMAEGPQGVGKTRAIDAVIQSLLYAGKVQGLARDDDKHTAIITLAFEINDDASNARIA